MKKYKLEDVLKTEDIYRHEKDGTKFANYSVPEGQISCLEVGTLKRGKWLVVDEYKETEIEII